MIEMVRNWLLGVTCAAILAALCDSLTPPGAVRRVGKLAGGLLLMLAVLRPLIGLDYNTLAGALAWTRTHTAEYGADADATHTNMAIAIIAEQTSAYIQDKATTLGMDCTVTVTCECVEGEFPIPVAVTVVGRFTDQQEAALRRAIEGDFAIPAGAQTYERDGYENE